MIEQKYIALINRYLDNEILDSERKDLDEFLNRSEEGVKYLNEISKITSYLNFNEGVVPSENLKKNILNSIDYSKYKRQERSSYLEKIYSIFTKFDRKIAISFCAGAAAVFLVFLVGNLNIEDKDINDISGTLVQNEDLSNFQSDEYVVDDELINGKIQEFLSEDMVNIEFALDSKGENQILIDFDSNSLQFSEIINRDMQNLKLDLKRETVLLEISGKSVFTLKFNKKSEILPQNTITYTINEKKL